ncbi:rhomboid family intramembrane serine protease [Ferruginibacter albus]|uniref:rhomboid family intramembrane serine protease n=1 Tax=Ferruginibacter albus TaxID=2875540 RepID=UPI001CC33393|nr:rhomboid family intramembrane serine protease [Ferruginibacter albus]UAY51991.1 rhomboid family intramembrane serine protease [Ferruginibacter albus]
MGESDRYSDYRSSKRRILFGDDNNAIVALFALNIIFFILICTIKVVYLFFQKDAAAFNLEVLRLFEMPAQLSQLGKHPWTVLVHMFFHVNVWDILSNMLWLWAFGYILQDLAGNQRLIPIYIYGGLVGALSFILANYLLPQLKAEIPDTYLWGANAATMAIATATTTLAPDYRFFRNLNGGIPIWVLTLIYVLIDYSAIAGLSAAYSISHLGGAFTGFLFIILLKKGVDGSTWMNNCYHWFMNLFTPAANSTPSSVREKVFYNVGGKQPYKKTTHVTQQRVDEILDKINQHGYRFLSDEEKNILKRAAEEDL